MVNGVKDVFPEFGLHGQALVVVNRFETFESWREMRFEVMLDLSWS